jgi:putative metallopeptidase DUF4344
VFAHVDQPRTSALAAAHYLLTTAGTLDSVAASLNRNYRISTRIQLLGTECGSEAGGYSRVAHRVVICFELVEGIRREWANAAAATSQEGWRTDFATQLALTFVIHHEIGHALIDVLHIPTVGREEDAADQFAAVVQLARGQGEPVNAALLTLGMWGARENPGALAALGDAHGLHLQRMLNLVCWIHGSGGDLQPSLLDMLPQARRANCRDEFWNVAESWTRLLAPYAR